jgi:hypothetical protein
MKKIKAILLVTILVFSVTGCSSQKAYEQNNTNDSVQVGGENDVKGTLTIDEKSAEQLVSERLDATKYSVKKDSDINVDDKDYYTFKIFEGDMPLTMGVAVDKISGELFAYKEDKTIAPYSEFTLYDESSDRAISWEGTFNNEAATLILAPADSNSFEFTLTSKDGKDLITGVAQASGKEAIYEDEKGYKLTFINEGETITITSGTSSDSTVFQGSYIK